MDLIHNLSRTMKSGNLRLVYRGDFSAEKINSILALGERTLESLEQDVALRRKVFNVMVESLQNIAKHGEMQSDVQRPHPAIFLMGKKPDAYFILSGNPIRNDRIPALQSALEKINNLDKAGLKSLYRKIIQKTVVSEKGGAGLGLLDMARKSSEKLSYDFQEISETYSFFCLKVNICRSLNQNELN